MEQPMMNDLGGVMIRNEDHENPEEELDEEPEISPEQLQAEAEAA